MSAYGEFRCGYEKDMNDQRIVFYGIRYIIENYIARKYTMEDIEQAALFFQTHNVQGTPYPFPKELFVKFVKENDGYFPVTIKALPEGSVVYPHVPVYEITAEGEYASLVTYLETFIKYPTTVCTLSRRCKSIIEKAYTKTVDPSDFWSLDSRLHDFGFRGCTSVEQSIIGGCAHLVNFEGTDTLSAAWYAQFKLNNSKPVGFSIPATEHSIMTSHATEREAMVKLLETFGSGVCACVMDSYDYTHALQAVLPSVAALKLQKGGVLVLRPDSGDPVQVVLEALRASEKIFGSEKNEKVFKVIKGVGVIQGDGLTCKKIAEIADAVEQEGFAANNVAYGMGGGLLQKVNRDTMSFATKVSFIQYANGMERDVMKMPKGDTGKTSLPGRFAVLRENNVPIVYPLEAITAHGDLNELKVVYDKGKVCKWDDFSTIKSRVQSQWNQCPLIADVLSPALKQKKASVMEKQRQILENHLKN